MLIRKSACTLLLFLLVSIGLSAQTRTITGRILSGKNTPVSGATIFLKHSKKTIAANDDEHLPPLGSGQEERPVFVVSAVGYETQEVAVTSSQINIVLKEASQGLNEVVVVGYGTARKKTSPGPSLPST